MSKILLSSFSCFLLSLVGQSALLAIPAFPGAEGFGAETPGGRGGRVIEVTNLNDSGAGSLRAACTAAGPRIVVFKVGGWITLSSPIDIPNPYITIAGQTAPGGGIGLRAPLTGRSFAPLGIRTHDVVIRYLTIRPGPGTVVGADVDAMGMSTKTPNQCYNIVIDHCSMSWTNDQVIASWYDARSITWSWNFITESLHYSTHVEGPHGTGAMFGSYADATGNAANPGRDNSFHHNLLAHNNARNPYFRGAGLHDIVNNVIYNPGGTATQNSYETSAMLIKVNLVKNYYKPGPNTVGGKYAYKTYRQKSAMGSETYVQGNIHTILRPADSGPEYLVVDPDIDRAVADPDTVGTPYSHLVARRWQTPPITEATAIDTYSAVLASAGNAGGVDAAGKWFSRRDAVDRRVVAEVQAGSGKIIDAPGLSTCTGICRGADYVLAKTDYAKYGITDPLDGDGWPIYESAAGYPDADHDGMPDAWELAHGLNPNDPSDANKDVDGDGYTNIEKYINGSDAGHANLVPPQGLRVMP